MSSRCWPRHPAVAYLCLVRQPGQLHMEIQLLLLPYDTARRSWRTGRGPEHLLQAGLATHLLRRGDRVAEPQFIEDDPRQAAAEIRTAFELCRRLAAAVRAARVAGRFPLVLSGNCNSAVGTLSGLTPARRAIFWFDAHGDCNTPETTTTGFLDGTGLATSLGMCWRQLAASVSGFQPVAPETTFLLGARDFDPPEAALLERSPISLVPVAQIPDRLRGVLATAALDDTLGYLHIDLECLGPRGWAGKLVSGKRRTVGRAVDGCHYRHSRPRATWSGGAHFLWTGV
jgi:arginase